MQWDFPSGHLVAHRVKFNIIYLLGNQTLTPVKFGRGKDKQDNPPHFLELYAALAVRDFLQAVSTQREKQENSKGQIATISVESSGKVKWNDIPEYPEVQKKLGTAARFAYSWLAVFYPELRDAVGARPNTIRRDFPWLEPFFNVQSGANSLPKLDQRQQDNAYTVGLWCFDFLRWLAFLHLVDEQGESKPGQDAIQLFKPKLFAEVMSFGNAKDGQTADLPKLHPGHLPNLIVGEVRRSNDDIQAQKDKLLEGDFNNRVIKKLGDRGTAGLAKSLYVICEILG